LSRIGRGTQRVKKESTNNKSSITYLKWQTYGHLISLQNSRISCSSFTNSARILSFFTILKFKITYEEYDDEENKKEKEKTYHYDIL